MKKNLFKVVKTVAFYIPAKNDTDALNTVESFFEDISENNYVEMIDVKSETIRIDTPNSVPVEEFESLVYDESGDGDKTSVEEYLNS